MKYLEEKMRTASETMEFEKAIEYRDLLESVRKVAQKQKITSQSMEDRDIIAMAKDECDAVVQVFFVRDGKLIGREHFHMNLTGSESKAEILNSFVKQFYAGTPFVPHEIWVQEELEDAEVIASFLTRAGDRRCALSCQRWARKSGWSSWRRRMRRWCSPRIRRRSSVRREELSER